MPTKILIKRGLESSRSGSVPDVGELILTTDTNRIFLGNAITSGGLHLTASIAVTASYVSFANIDGKPTLFSSSVQVVNSLPLNTVSSSAQIVNLLPTNIVSSSAQVTNLLPLNVVSSSGQLSNGGAIAFNSSNNVTFGSVTASVAFLGALVGTSSWATNAVSVAYDGITGKPSLVSSSAQVVALLPDGVMSGSAQTVANLVGQNVSLTELTASVIKVTTLFVETVSSSILYSTGSNRFGSDDTNTHTFTGSVLMRGNLNVGSGITGSLLGTASYALQALTASFAMNFNPSATASYTITAATASYVDYVNVKNITVDSQFAGTASYSITSSYALQVDGGIF